MLDRPSTSGGPSSKSEVKNQFNFDKYDKRVSRDDFYLSMNPGAGSGYKQHATFRGQLPTPEGSPLSRAPTRPSIPIVRMPTPDSIGESSSTPIGMALGSPTHQPTDWSSWSPQQTLRPEAVPTMVLASPLSTVSSMDSYDMPREKKQSGKWKLFGMFGRKHVDHAPPTVTISEPNELKGTHRLERNIPKSQAQTEARPSRSNTTLNRSGPKHKPIVVRSQTMPYEGGQAQDTKSTRPSKTRNPSTDTVGSSSTFAWNESSLGSRSTGADTVAPSKALSPLLNVDIPQSTMERYSVMFGSVLQTQPSGSSALLARRQATLRELRNITDAVIKEEEEKQLMNNPLVRPRRATSPQPTQSPRFALFPATPRASSRLSSHHQQVSHPPSRIARSNTSPAMLPSPSKATFGEPLYNHQPSYNYLKPSPDPTDDHASNKMTIATLAKSKENTATRQGVQFGQGESGLILESPTDVYSPQLSPEIIRTESVRPKIHEPQWQMIDSASHAAPSTASSITSSRKRSPSSVSSAQTHVTKPSVDLDEPDNIKMNPVEISIARQISISRQQRMLLQPLQTSLVSSKSRTSPGNPSPPIPRIAMGKNERMAEISTGTPTIVTPRQTFDSQFPQHRKSERIVIEG
ncbi:hypothetical protein BJ170DRAFT_240935 [Xylariales sp. AK1849]|nr:hypothetical protein BJ170DRAFT_240935 [Xylariales sp. AK1849]